jgi:RNA polymerase sigma-70 factor (ECF subfamily)
VRHVKPEKKLLNQSVRDSDPTSVEPGTHRDLPSRTDATADLADVFSRYIEPIYQFLYARVGNREDAEDLASATFLKASRQLDTGRSEASIAGWLFTVARTVLADHWRKYYRHGVLLPLDEFHLDTVTDPVTPAAELGERERLVTDILEALPQRYRRVLQLRFLAGLSVRDTAQEMGVTPGNAKILQYRALAKAVKVGDGSLPPSAISCTPGPSGEPEIRGPAA